MRAILSAVGLAIFATAAPEVARAADELPGAREAWRLMFGTRGSVSAIPSDVQLTDEQKEIIEKLGPTQKYYGAIAYSPEEGLVSDATVAAANHHAVEVARTLALEECNRRRKAGVAPCEIAADIVPRRYEPGRPLQLSIDATYAFGQEFRRAERPRSFAISAQTGLWGFGSSDAEALAACNADDCKVVVRD